MKKILTALFVISYAFAVAQEQLTDIVRSAGPHSSNPKEFVIFNDNVFFTAQTEDMGLEIWKSDGSPDGTTLLKDINIGVGSSIISNFLTFKGKLYFVANDNIHGYQLWTTDGTGEGTVPVTNNMDYRVTRLVATDDFIYYLKKPSNYSLEVWKSDGTTAGTTLVKGSIPIWNAPQNLTSALGLVFFSMQDEGSNESRIWRTDGTDQGTFHLTHLLDGNGSGPSGTSDPTQFIEYNGAVYFVVRDWFSNGETVGIMKTDGTVEGTEHILGMYNGNMELMEFSDVTVNNNKMYFSFFDVDNRHLFIWESDGLAANTKLIYNYYGHVYFAPSTLLGLSEHLYFTSGNAAGGTSLVRINTTTLASEEIRDISQTQTAPFMFFDDTDCNTLMTDGINIFVRSIFESYAFADLWRSNGTREGTTLLGRISRHDGGALFKDNQLFFGGTADSDIELWKSDGTTTGTGLVRNISDTDVYSGISGQLYQVGDVVYFNANHQDYGMEVWVSDGTASGTSLIDLTPGTTGSYPSGFLPVDGKLYFLARTNTTVKVFTSDGTTSGTKWITEFPSGFVKLAYIGGDNLLAFARKEDGSNSLYSINMATGLKDEINNLGLNEYGVALSAQAFAVTNSTLYYLVSGAGTDLWKSDGTAQGTVHVAHFYEATSLTAAGSNVYFSVQPDFTTATSELYKSDGTMEGTSAVKDMNGATIPNPENLFAHNSQLLVVVSTPDTGREIWITDGATGNTKLLKDINEGTPSGVFNPQFVISNGMVFFSGTTDAHGAELWRTDGTESGTVMVKDIVPGPQSSKPASLSVAGDRLYFSAFTPEAGTEVWKSDGTAEGTELVIDVLSGPTYSNPSSTVMLGGKLLIIASTESHGAQVWSFTEAVTGIFDEDRDIVDVYPNPSFGIFNLQLKAMRGGAVTIYDSRGYCVSAVSDAAEMNEIDLRHLPAGLYVMKIAKGKETKSVKVLKK